MFHALRTIATGVGYLTLGAFALCGMWIAWVLGGGWVADRRREARIRAATAEQSAYDVVFFELTDPIEGERRDAARRAHPSWSEDQS